MGREANIENSNPLPAAYLIGRLDRLTPRELEILQLMAEGRSSQRIAGGLGMSPHTLRTHVQNILTKLGVHSKLEALVAAIRYGKVSTDEDTAPEAAS